MKTALRDLTPAATEPSLCPHCARPVPPRMRGPFCCPGCETVHAILKGAGLTDYYRINARGGTRPGTVRSASASFAYLDDPRVRSLHEDGGAARFYLEGVHCAACVWLVEKLPRLAEGVAAVRLDLGTSIATVRLKQGGSYAEAAVQLQRLGYRPHAVRVSEENDCRERENRMLLMRLGIAAACAGNIMLLAVALYAGADGVMAREFRWVSFGLSLPVMLFSAVPFYRSSLSALRARELSIDIPVALGLLVSFSVSVANLLLGNDRIYFDSLTTLVFLLLSSRYLLRRVQRSALSASSLAHHLMPALAARLDHGSGGKTHQVSVEDLRAQDLVEVLPGECVPCDGEVVSGSSAVNSSLLTGESRSEPVSAGSAVFAGTMNLQGPLTVRVSVSGSESRVGRIFQSMEESLRSRAPLVAFSDRVSRGFIAATLALLPIVLVLGARSGGWEPALDRALALSLVMCPCAFALAAPLAFAVTLGRCARAGILVKGADALERLSRVRVAYFDKTGTLTQGQFSVLAWESALSEEETARVITALESRSRHPIGQALACFFERIAPGALPVVEGLKEVLGEGVSGTIGGKRYRLGASPAEARSPDPGAIESETRVSLWLDDTVIATVRLGDPLRDDALAMAESLRALDVSPAVLSGDSGPVVSHLARGLGICPSRVFAQASPERKKQVIDQAGKGALMVGDGANDSVSLASAYVSVAVQGGLEASIRAADVYLSRPGLDQLPRLIIAARETMKVVKRCFAVSLVYNAVAATAAVLGMITPLFAAILMPISAFAVIASAIAGTARLRRALRP